GRAEGGGKRAFISFGRLLVCGGRDKILSPSPKSQDASEIYKAFSAGSRKAATIGKTQEGDNLVISADAQVNSEKAQLSKARALMTLGLTYQDDAEPIYDTALQLHAKLMHNPATAERLKLRSTYAAIV